MENLKNTLAIHQTKAPQKKFTIGVFLPIGYLNGVLRGAKNIAKMLKLGSQADGNPVNVIFSYIGDTYDVTSDFADLVKMDISIRETRWETITKHEIGIANSFKGVPLEDEKKSYLLPTDGMSNFNDCDFWLLVSDRTSPAIAPLKPYGAVVYDYIQRYFTGITSSNYKQYLATEAERIRTARNAQFVIVNTPQGREDAIQYAGLNANKVLLMPIEFNLVKVSTKPEPNNPYFIWTTNPSPHKNHLRALQALEIYYQQYDGKLEVAVTGFDPATFDKTVTRYIEKSPLLKKKLNFLGHLSEARYWNVLSQAKFLWHPTLIDNGTFSVIEAAYYQVPSLSSNYPQMRYLDEQFRLNLFFSDALSCEDMAEKLSFMEKNSQSRKALLPDRHYLEQFTYQQVAQPFWQIIKEYL